MTEEIIIDGVDIAGCEHYTTMEDCDGIHDLCEQLDDYCSIKKNCYYKQLQRSKQENKELKAELNKVIDEREKKIEETLLKGCHQSLGSECRIYELKESKYRSALEEINILAKNYCNACDEFKAKTYKNKNDCLYCNYGFIKRKINEV